VRKPLQLFAITVTECLRRRSSTHQQLSRGSGIQPASPTRRSLFAFGTPRCWADLYDRSAHKYVVATVADAKPMRVGFRFTNIRFWLPLLIHAILSP